MKVVISGVAGFIGSNLAKRLLDEGHQVLGVDNFSFGERRNIEPFATNPNFDFLERDLREENSLAGLQANSLVHLASQKIPRYSNAWRTMDDNARMVGVTIRRCVQASMHLLFASTSDVYGKNPDVPYHEESDLLMGPTTVRRWAYAVSKISSEYTIQAAHQEFGLEYTIMRFFGSYGPNQNITWWGGPQSVFIQNILEGKPLDIHGDGNQTRTFTYVEDTVDGIYRCITQPAARNRIFNIAGNPEEEITITDLAKLIYRLMRQGDEAPTFRIVPYESFGKYEDVRRRVPSIRNIMDQLGFHPAYSLNEGLIKTIRWQSGLFRK